MLTKHRFLAVAAGLMLSVAANAHDTSVDVVPNFSHAIPNIPGKSVVAVEVNFAPGAISAPHTHAKSAFIYAYVVSGTIRSQVEGEAPRDFHAGESWSENPGAYHTQAQNMSKTAPAKLLAVFVVDSDDKQLTTPDK